MFLPRKILEERLLRILAEDIGQGDITTELIVQAKTIAHAKIIAKETGIIAGIEEAETLMESLGLTVETLVEDGKPTKAKQTLLKIQGNARAILSAERTVLNILSRMSSIATTTRRLSEKLQRSGFKAKIACTRKAAPGLLYFDKKAVLLGGGDPHRFHLDDMILIKDNHIAIAGSVEQAIKKAKERASFSKRIEVEVATAKDALSAARAGPDIIMLDNFEPKQIEEVCKAIRGAKSRGKIMLEASGGITEKNILKYAATGVDIVSLGGITHSPKALDMSLEIVKISRK